MFTKQQREARRARKHEARINGQRLDYQLADPAVAEILQNKLLPAIRRLAPELPFQDRTRLVVTNGAITREEFRLCTDRLVASTHLYPLPGEDLGFRDPRISSINYRVSTMYPHFSPPGDRCLKADGDRMKTIWIQAVAEGVITMDELHYLVTYLIEQEKQFPEPWVGNDAAWLESIGYQTAQTAPAEWF